MQKTKKNLAKNVIWFCENYLNVDFIDSDIKAHHVLPTRRELPDGVIPKFYSKINSVKG